MSPKIFCIAVLALTCLNASAEGLPAPITTVDLKAIRLDCAAAAAGVALSKNALQDLDRQGWDTAKLCAQADRLGPSLANLENSMTQSKPAATAAGVVGIHATSSWMLILTILGSNGIGVAVDHVPGYASEEQCQKAAAKWKADFEPEKISGFRSAVCTEQT